MYQSIFSDELFMDASGNYCPKPQAAHLHFDMMQSLSSYSSSSVGASTYSINPLITYDNPHDKRNPRYRYPNNLTPLLYNPSPFFAISGDITKYDQNEKFYFNGVNPYFNWWDVRGTLSDAHNNTDRSFYLP